MAESDPEPKVRGKAWASLADTTEDTTIREKMLAVLNDNSDHFTTFVVPELLITLGVLEVRDAYEQVNALYPE